MIKVIVFDLDDTLFSEQDFVASGFKAVGEWLEKKHGIVGFFHEAYDVFKKGKRGNIFNLALENMGVCYREDMIHEMLLIYRDHFPAISLHHDAAWIIQHYFGNKHLSLITDGYITSQKKKVAALGLEEKLLPIIYSDEFGRKNWKPSELPYRKVMDFWGYQNHEYVYVGDNPTKDFVTAKRLRWLTVRVKRENGEYTKIQVETEQDADHTIISLRQLTEIIV
jgi:putative hydrolase of the HAD superfamily